VSGTSLKRFEDSRAESLPAEQLVECCLFQIGQYDPGAVWSAGALQEEAACSGCRSPADCTRLARAFRWAALHVHSIAESYFLLCSLHGWPKWCTVASYSVLPWACREHAQTYLHLCMVQVRSWPTWQTREHWSAGGGGGMQSREPTSTMASTASSRYPYTPPLISFASAAAAISSQFPTRASMDLLRCQSEYVYEFLGRSSLHM
jgi:hypothetical protein